MKHIIQYIIGKSSELVEQPLFNFASIIVVVASTIVLFARTFTHISLDYELLYAHINLILLEIIALETLIRLFTAKSRKYTRSPAFIIDIFTLIPLFIEFASQSNLIGSSIPQMALKIQNQPGYLLFQGIRSLRLMPISMYFHKQRQLSTFGMDSFSPLKSYILARITILTSAFILILGLAASILYGNSIQTQKKHRIQQIQIQARSNGVLQTRLIFEKHVLGAYITQHGERKFIPGIKKGISGIQNDYKYQRDYLQLDEPQPGQSIIISFKDLVIKQNRIELLILLTGILLVLSLIYSLHFYIEKLIAAPLEIARRTTELRLSGEEILITEIKRYPYTEITRSINDTDRLYQKLRAPARRLITDRNLS